MVIAFTGHRDVASIQLNALLLNEIMYRVEQGYHTFLCGAAWGMDIAFGRQVLLVKGTNYPHIRLICAIPHEEQAKSWTEYWRNQYYDLLEQADDMALISRHYTRDCYHRRNQYMVDSADVLLAVYDGREKGGTAYTVRYAATRGKEIVCFHPTTLHRTVHTRRDHD